MTPDDFAPKPRPQQLRSVEPVSQPAPFAEPTDTEYVAVSVDRLRYLDLKDIAKAIMGEAKPQTPAELADLMAEWAAANKTKVQP